MHLTNNQYKLVSKRSLLQQFTDIFGETYCVGYRIKRDNNGYKVSIDFKSMLKKNNEFLLCITYCDALNILK